MEGKENFREVSVADLWLGVWREVSVADLWLGVWREVSVADLWLGVWREVSVGGGVYGLRESRSAPTKGRPIPSETRKKFSNLKHNQYFNDVNSDKNFF